MIERVIVGIDFSDGSRAALMEGEHLAEKLGVPCMAVHVLPSTGSVFPEILPNHLDPLQYEGQDVAHAEHLLEWVAQLPKVAAKVMTGAPAKQLVSTSDPNALLVIGHQRKSMIANILFDSTTRWVLDHAPCPVLVVPSHSGLPGKEAEH